MTHLWFNKNILSLGGELPMLFMDWNLWQIEDFPADIFYFTVSFVWSSRCIWSLCQKLALEPMGWDPCQFGDLILGLSRLLWRILC